ncbi:MAG: M1 family metallopeptidase [Ignavibacteria bacterium]|nr:M1 family metallopeptidase [Ignavibacteria bacterium]
MKLLSLLFSFFLLSQISVAQEYSGKIPPILRMENSSDEKSMTCSHATHSSMMAINRPTGSAINRRPYDVLSYKLFLDWRSMLSDTGTSPESRRYSGVNEILVHIDSANTSRLTFNAGTMIIDSVFSRSNKIATFSQPTSINQVTVTLPTSMQAGDTATIKIYYTYTGATNKGFFLFPKGMFVGLGPRPAEDSVFVEERLAYTMSEPQEARFWMPCNDAPYDKASAKITVRVPFENSKSALQFTVSSNGTRTIGAPQDDGKGNSYRDFIWQDTTPIPTYLMVVNASKFKEYSQWYKRVTNPNDSVEIINYSWPNDLGNDSIKDGSKYNTLHSFRNVPSMMEYYSTKFGEYPFVKYGHTAAQPFNYGGMEHQTMTTINRSWLRGNSEIGIAHELMHQWTGDLVTCATWNDIWLNEGGATYGEALFYESWGGEERYQQIMNDKRDGYLKTQPQPPIYGININNIFNYATTYCKAGWVYGMLRKMLGDSVFFPVMQQYFTKHRFQSIETEDMVKTFEELVPNPPVPFRTFFDQWIYSAGHPVYELSTKQYYNSPVNQRLVVSLRQTQVGEDVPQVFEMPVNITFIGTNNEQHTVRFINNQRDEQFETFYVPFVVSRVVLDSTNEILCEKVMNVVSVDEAESTDQISVISPNPVSSGNECRFELLADKLQNYTVDLIDILGQKVKTLQEGLLPIGRYSINIPTSVLAQSIYSVRVYTIAGSKDYPFVVLH